MGKQRFEPVEQIELGQADGDVAIRGWDEAAIELAVDGDESECTVEVQDEALALSCRAPLELRVPRSTVIHAGDVAGELLLDGLDRAVSVGTVRGDAFVGNGNASVSVQVVHGDMGVEHLDGPFSVSETHGDLHLKQVSTARVGSVHGDVHAQDVAAELEMGVVSGDVRLGNVAGAVTLEEARGDFRGRELVGGVTAHHVRGSVSLKTTVTPGCAYSVRAQGDISARFPQETSARFTLSAQDALSAKGFEVEEQETGQYLGQAGEGEAEVTLDAGGSLNVKVRTAKDEQEHVWGPSMEALGAEIEAEIEAHRDEFDDGEIAREVERAMQQAKREIARAQERAQRAAKRAQERARHAEERARRAQEKALQRAKKFQARVDVDWQPRDRGRGRPRKGRPAKPGASSEEQTTILSMLQAGKISVEEAEVLLKALGS